mgnify:CR=1 FL=1
MNKIIYSLVYNRKKCLNKKRNGTGTSRSLFGQKEEILFNKVYLKPEQWDAKKLVVKNHPNALMLSTADLRICRSNREKRIGIMAAGQTYIIGIIKGCFSYQREQFFIYYLSLSKRFRIRL